MFKGKKEIAIKLLSLIMTSKNVSHRSDSFLLVVPFSAGQAGQSSRVALVEGSFSVAPVEG